MRGAGLGASGPARRRSPAAQPGWDGRHTQASRGPRVEGAWELEPTATRFESLGFGQVTCAKQLKQARARPVIGFE